jgi:hypothetical protein
MLNTWYLTLIEEPGHRIFELKTKERGGGWSEKIV